MTKDIVCRECGCSYLGVRDFGKCPECRKKSKRIYNREYQRRPECSGGRKQKYSLLRESVIVGYGGKCLCCGETRREFLAIDHVDGDGRKERKTRSIYQIMMSIVEQKFPDDYRILCHNCNQSLGWYGYCPHGNPMIGSQVIKIIRKRVS